MSVRLKPMMIISSMWPGNDAHDSTTPGIVVIGVVIDASAPPVWLFQSSPAVIFKAVRHLKSSVLFFPKVPRLPPESERESPAVTVL